MGNKIGYIAVTYCSPRQTASKFAILLNDFEKNLYQIQQFRSPFVVILSGWKIDSLATIYGMQQIIFRSYPNFAKRLQTNEI